MDVHRKKARDYLKSIKTKKELIDYLDTLMLTKEEKEIVYLIYASGYSHVMISEKYHISIEKSKKIVRKALNKAL